MYQIIWHKIVFLIKVNEKGCHDKRVLFESEGATLEQCKRKKTALMEILLIREQPVIQYLGRSNSCGLYSAVHRIKCY